MSKVHIVEQGECINSIAFQHGFAPDTLWTHADNQKLRELRTRGNVLQAGDKVNIPDLTTKQFSGGAEQTHRFRMKGVPAVLRMIFNRREVEDDGTAETETARFGDGTYEDVVVEEPESTYEPIANEAYVISGEIEAEGESESDGLVEIPIPPDVRSATITFFQGTKEEVSFDLALGNLDPVDTAIGASQRLSNLSYNCTPDAETLDGVLAAALRRFQNDNELTVSGEIDAATQDKLLEVHGS
jgi:hypothetical protein